eukprot:6490551-Amphidinium_carterae.3
MSSFSSGCETRPRGCVHMYVRGADMSIPGNSAAIRGLGHRLEEATRDKSERFAELQGRMRPGNDDEVNHLREQLELERAKLDQLAWEEEARTQDIRVALDADPTSGLFI